MILIVRVHTADITVNPRSTALLPVLNPEVIVMALTIENYTGTCAPRFETPLELGRKPALRPLSISSAK